MNITRTLLTLFTLLISNHVYADIPIYVSATLTSPACSIYSENSTNLISVDFKDIALDKLSEEKQTFNILLKGCDFNKKLKMQLTAKGGSAIWFNYDKVLATSIDGLGIRFTEENKNFSLNLDTWVGIAPVVSGNTGKLTLQAQLVTNEPVQSLTAGPFTAALSILIKYI